MKKPSAYVEVPSPRESECTGKEAFTSPQMAYRILKARRSMPHREFYRCDYCGQYHIGRGK